MSTFLVTTRVIHTLKFKSQNLLNDFFILVLQTETESATDELIISINVVNVRTDLVWAKSGSGVTALCPSLAYVIDNIANKRRILLQCDAYSRKYSIDV